MLKLENLVILLSSMALFFKIASQFLKLFYVQTVLCYLYLKMPTKWKYIKELNELNWMKKSIYLYLLIYFLFYWKMVETSAEYCEKLHVFFFYDGNESNS